ncbi:ATP-binding cassette domain-containing protein [Actinomadura sp. NPDC000600]|uniref:ABC transporter ATP-binding protein n=1 Tax=Actinomadura sp. NPDC000600 TaxID=3154262 RepID=UPI0033995D99
MSKVTSARPITSPLVEVEDLRKSFTRRDGQTVPAIDGVSLEIALGEFVVLLGPSGCGKTTLLRCLAGLEEPDDGEIRMRGRTHYSGRSRVFLPPERRNLSMVFQSYALWPHMTVYDNVAFPLRHRKVPKHDIPRRVARTLERIGIGDLRNSYPSQISGGQQQRVALARALVTNDELVLFDEPLSNVDARVRDELRFELLEMQREIGFAAVYVTHDQGEAMAMADRIAVLGGGRIRQLGSPRDVYTRPASLEVATFIGTANRIPGTVLAVDGDGQMVADTQLGKVWATDRDRSLEAGDDVVLIWRPESAVVADEAPAGPNTWPASVAASVFVGTHTEADLSVGPLRQRVWSVGRDLPAAGSSAHVSVPASKLLAFRV